MRAALRSWFSGRLLRKGSITVRTPRALDAKVVDACVMMETSDVKSAKEQEVSKMTEPSDIHARRLEIYKKLGYGGMPAALCWSTACRRADEEAEAEQKRSRHTAIIQRLSSGWEEPVQPPNLADLVDQDVDTELVERDRVRVIRPGQYFKAAPNPKQTYGDAKVALHLIPAAGLIYTAKAMKEGAKKYGPFNWRKDHVEGMTYVGAVLRHVFAWIDGEDIDPDSKDDKPHLAGALASLHILVDAIEGGFLIDNRPPKGPAPKMLSDNDHS